MLISPMKRKRKEPTEKESERWNFLSIVVFRRRSVNKSLPRLITYTYYSLYIDTSGLMFVYFLFDFDFRFSRTLFNFTKTSRVQFMFGFYVHA